MENTKNADENSLSGRAAGYNFLAAEDIPKDSILQKFVVTKADLYDMLIDYAKKYRLHANESLMRNQHMHMNYNPGIINIPQPEIDAILTDYINFVAFKQCCDLALYSEDLAKKL